MTDLPTWESAITEAADVLREARMVVSGRVDVAKQLDEIASSWLILASEIREQARV